MGLDLKVVVIRNLLRRRLGVVAAGAILPVELKSKLLLISQRNLFDLEFDWLLRFCRGACGKLISPGDAAESNGRGELSAGIGQAAHGVEVSAHRSIELDQRSGDGR